MLPFSGFRIPSRGNEVEGHYASKRSHPPGAGYPQRSEDEDFAKPLELRFGNGDFLDGAKTRRRISGYVFYSLNWLQIFTGFLVAIKRMEFAPENEWLENDPFLLGVVRIKLGC